MNPQEQRSTVSDAVRKHKEFLFPAVATYYQEPLALVKGEGEHVWDDQGNEYLDCFGGVLTVSLGHANPRVNKAWIDQVNSIAHTSTLYANQPQSDLAEKLAEISPGKLKKSFFTNSGTEADDTAVLAAKLATGNSEIVVLRHSYAGRSATALSSIGHSSWKPIASQVPGFVHAHAPYCYRCPLGLKRASCKIDCLEDLERRLEEQGERTAAVLVEPMLQGAGGMIVWPAEFLAGVRRLCDRYGVLLIANEVLTGFGRTGRMFACEHADVKPDILCLSKALTAGYLPMGVTAATEAIYEAFLSTDRGQAFFHGHSYTANPLACAVAIASLELFRESDVLARVGRLEKQLRAGLEPLRSVGVVRVIGGVGVVELEGDSGYLADIGPRLGAAFLKRNLLLRPLGNIVYFMPPYAITDDEVAWALEQIRDLVGAL